MQSGSDKVARFVVLVSPTAGNPQSALVIDVGKPLGTPTPVGTQFSALVSIEPDTYVAVAAIGFDGLRSAPSNWMLPVPTQPGQPRLVVE
jgi:hypothetical protein